MEYGAKDESKINDFFVSGIKKKKKKTMLFDDSLRFFLMFIFHIFFCGARALMQKSIFIHFFY